MSSCWEEAMANIKSAIKRIKTSKRNRARNTKAKLDLKKRLKALDTAVKAKSADFKKVLSEAVSFIDKMAERGIIHKNKAANKKSKLMKKLNKIKTA